MTQDEFIEKFVSVYPRLYVKLISYNLALSESNLVDYGFLLSWDKYGVLGNSNIDWTRNLKIRYANRLGSEFIKPDTQHYLCFDKNIIKDDISDIAINPTARKYGLSLYSLKISELTLDILREYKDHINNWALITYYFDKIDYDFIIEFRKYIVLQSLLFNFNIDWSDIRLFSLFPSANYNLVDCKYIWTNFVRKFVNNQNFGNHLKAFNNLDKFVKIKRKYSERNQDNTMKYLLCVYVKSNDGHQLMTSGYYRTEKDITEGKTFDIDSSHEFPIKSDYLFPRKKQTK